MTTSVQPITDIIFDIGNVLLAFDPRWYYQTLPMFAGHTDKLEAFLNEICTRDWHEQHDLGRSYEETAAELANQHPDYAEAIYAWGPNFDDMLRPIPGTIDILRHIREKSQIRLHALTNFPLTSFQRARKTYDFLGYFYTVVVSGEEGIKKPDPVIFHRMIERTGITPASTIFVDDNAANCAEAKRQGLILHRFETPEIFYGFLVEHQIVSLPVPAFVPSPQPKPF